jgi:hypothetical protein
MNRNLVGSTYGRFGIKFSQNRIKGERHRLSPLRLYDCTYEQETFLAYLHSKRICCTRRMPSLTCIYVFLQGESDDSLNRLAKKDGLIAKLVYIYIDLIHHN